MPNEPPTLYGQHAQPLGRDPEQVLGERAAQAEHALAADVQREAPARRIVLGDRRARLHRRHHDPVVDQPEPGDVGGRGERALGRGEVAKAPVEAEVGAARRAAAARRARSAASASVTAGSGSMSSTISSAASLRRVRALSATTIASGSPT